MSARSTGGFLAIMVVVLGSKPSAAQPTPVPVPVPVPAPAPVTPAPVPPVTPPTFLPGSPGVVPPPAPPGTPTPVPVPVPVPPAPANPQPTPPAPPGPMPTLPTPMPTMPAPTPPIAPTSDGKPIEYPKQIDGRDLATWLKEIAISTSTGSPLQTDPQSREIAIRILPNFGPTARKPALAPLIATVTYDPDPGVRQAAIIVISNMGYEDDGKGNPAGSLMGKSAVVAIKSRLAKTAPGSAERLTCVRSLASFGSDGVSSVADLNQVRADSSYETRIAIANALGRVGAAADEHAEASKQAAMILLDHMVIDPCASVRMEAIQSLLLLGPPKVKNIADYPKAIEPYLKGVAARLKPEPGRLGEKDPNVTCWLLLLQMMYDSTTMDANVKALANMVKTPPDSNHPDNLRTNAINALAVLGPKAVGALDAVIDALHYDDPYLVAAAISCIAPMGTAAAKAVPELEKIAGGSKDPPKPEKAPADWKPDESLRNLAKLAIEYVKGTKKFGVPDPAPAAAPKP